MKIQGYQIERHQPAQRPRVVDVIGHLLGGDRTANERYLGWKYEQNPHADGATGIVAKHGGKVVGFRGYGPSLWRSANGRAMRVPVPGDTCAWAFLPLAEKVYLSRYGLPGLAAYLLSSKKQRPLAAANIRYGQFGDRLVSAAPMAEQMASVIARQKPSADRFRLCQDEGYFRWRFSCPADRFVFYCLSAGGDTVAYLVLGVTPANHRAYVMDYADTDGESGARLLDFVIKRRDFSVLPVFSHSVSASLEPALRRAGFHAGGILGALERKVRGNMPLLVRPVLPKPEEKDWFIEGVDVRNPDNWFIKGICSDSTIAPVGLGSLPKVLRRRRNMGFSGHNQEAQFVTGRNKKRPHPNG